MEVECKKCHRKFTDTPKFVDKINDHSVDVYMHKGEAVCADCLIGMGVLPDHNTRDHDTVLLDSVRFLMR